MATGTEIIRRIRRLISDESNATVSGYRWSDAELLNYITEAQRAVVALKPEAYVFTRAFAPEVAQSRQSLSVGLVADEDEDVSAAPVAYRLIRVEANEGAPPPPAAGVWDSPLVFLAANGAFNITHGQWCGLKTEWHVGGSDGTPFGTLVSGGVVGVDFTPVEEGQTYLILRSGADTGFMVLTVSLPDIAAMEELVSITINPGNVTLLVADCVFVSENSKDFTWTPGFIFQDGVEYTVDFNVA